MGTTRTRVKLFYLNQSLAVQTALILVGVALLLVVAILVFGVGQVVAVAPVAALMVALLSVTVAAVSAISNWRRQKREATIKAWIDWSDSSIESRRVLTQYFGTNMISEEQASFLIQYAEDPDSFPEADRGRVRSVGNAVVGVLNGLERIATAANMGVYDRRTLVLLGGTIIVRHFERLRPYVMARRADSAGVNQQAKAFIQLEDFVAGLESRRLVAERQKLDEERLRRLQERNQR